MLIPQAFVFGGMYWKCILGHRYKILERHCVQVFDEALNIPTEHFTRFLSKCQVCNKLKVDSLPGYFDGDDDKGDGGEDPSLPILSPDDFYDAILK